jgi:hypothetical protein
MGAELEVRRRDEDLIVAAAEADGLNVGLCRALTVKLPGVLAALAILPRRVRLRGCTGMALRYLPPAPGIGCTTGREQFPATSVARWSAQACLIALRSGRNAVLL